MVSLLNGFNRMLSLFGLSVPGLLTSAHGQSVYWISSCGELVRHSVPGTLVLHIRLLGNCMG